VRTIADRTSLLSPTQPSSFRLGELELGFERDLFNSKLSLGVYRMTDAGTRRLYP
jgi:hypothetical protein